MQKNELSVIITLILHGVIFILQVFLAIANGLVIYASVQMNMLRNKALHRGFWQLRAAAHGEKKVVRYHGSFIRVSSAHLGNTFKCLKQGVSWKKNYVTFPHEIVGLNMSQKTFLSVRFYSLPPHSQMVLPALSPTMQSGSIVKWEIKEGDAFNAGDLLAEIETDKATVGFEAVDDGFMAKIILPDGTKDIPIGTLVAISVENEDDLAAFKDISEGDKMFLSSMHFFIGNLFNVC